jgi:hypothetical protein
MVAAVTVAAPVAIPVTVPFVPTEATASSELVQFTLLSVAFDGVTDAVRVEACPTMISTVAGATLTPLTAMGVITVIAQLAWNPPSTVVAVIVTVPKATPVTIPFVSTDATAESDDLQVTPLFVASDGVMTHWMG